MASWSGAQKKRTMEDLFRATDAETRLRHVVEAGLVVAAAFAVGIVVAIAGLWALLRLGLTREADFVAMAVASTVLQFVGFYLVVAWYFSAVRSWRDLVFARRPTLRDLGYTIVGLVGLLVVLAVVEEILAGLGTRPAPNQIVEIGNQEPVVFLYLVPVTVLFVAPAEELLFRGVVQGSLRRAYGVVPAVGLAGAVFGVVHVIALGPGGSVTATILVIVALGVVLGAVYELAGNVLVPIAIHALWNVLSFLVAYAQATGGLA